MKTIVCDICKKTEKECTYLMKKRWSFFRKNHCDWDGSTPFENLDICDDCFDIISGFAKGQIVAKTNEPVADSNSSHTNTVYMCIGLPGSGKSTWSKKKAQNSKTIIVNQDSLRTMFKGKYFYEKEYEPLVHETTEVCLKEALKRNFDVILDQTNLGIVRRIYWIHLIKKCGNTKIVYVHFTENENNLSRRMTDPKSYSRETWNNIIEEMKKVFQPPSIEEKYDMLITVDGEGKEEIRHNRMQ